jgi:hypothetical protein
MYNKKNSDKNFKYVLKTELDSPECQIFAVSNIMGATYGLRI